MPQSTLFAIVCLNENSSILSNRNDLSTWQAVEFLVLKLNMMSPFTSEDVLLNWRKNSSHLASAKEAYAWRSAIDAIKSADIEKASSLVDDPGSRSLAVSRPVMLKLAGEIANSLLHSYNLRHRIAFAQISSTEPS